MYLFLEHPHEDVYAYSGLVYLVGVVCDEDGEFYYEAEDA